MQRSLFSSSWHLVANLKPQLAKQARVYRHRYRGRQWFVIHDQPSGKYHRFTPAACQFIGRMDGRATVNELWEQSNNEATQGDFCTQNEVVEILVQLHQAGLLFSDLPADAKALFRKYRKKKREIWRQYAMSPLSLKVPLFNPDGILDRLSPVFTLFFTRAGAILWLAAVLPAAVLALQHWSELTENFAEQVLASSNLLVLMFVYPVVKTIHEFGHAFAVRRWGGRVREMGLMFLLFIPVPYLDASASIAFGSRWRRAIVGMAGMMAELLVAAGAMYFWVSAEQGVARAVAYNVMVVAGVSTLIVNGNPLLRYDGYYILCDLLDMPNLAQRGTKYWTWLLDRYVYGAEDLIPLPESRAEKWWMALYKPLAFVYRIFISLTIAIFMAAQYFIIGVILAIWTLVMLVAMPAWKSYKHLAESASIQRRRERAIRLTLGFMALVAAVLLWLPVPSYTVVQAVVWLPDEAIVRARNDGFLRQWGAEQGEMVESGEVLFYLTSTELDTSAAVAQERVKELEIQLRAQEFVNPVEAEVTRNQLQQENMRLQELQQSLQNLVGVAKQAGRLSVQDMQNQPGRFYRKGEIVAYVFRPSDLLIRAVVGQDDVDRVRNHTERVKVRFSDSLHKISPVAVLRPPHAAVNELPSPALSVQQGGEIPAVTGQDGKTQTQQGIFLTDLALPEDFHPVAFGERAYVRFEHPWESLATQGYRRVRQLFLSKYNV